MKKTIILGLLLICIGMLGACGEETQDLAAKSVDENTEIDDAIADDTSTEETEDEKETDVAEEETYFKMIKLESKALEGNLAGDSATRSISVYLPPSYYDSDKSYPVVYYCHGHMESAESFVIDQKSMLDNTFAGGAKEFILVGIDAANANGGSFYVNSPVTGNWEDYAINEVIPMIDETFRTLDCAESRGICGFSMGGFGAFYLGFRHPDVFSSVLMMSPGLIADGDMNVALYSWISDQTFLEAYAQAFSPNIENTEIYGNIITQDDIINNTQVLADWYSGFGNINEKLDAYESLETPLKAIKLVCGENDGYPFIPRGCVFLQQCFDERGISYTFDKFSGGHQFPPLVSPDYIVPFFNENLVY